jgi:hypothetical protein
MGFRNAILGGVTLIREAIQSSNFLTGVSGWRVKSDGTAEFNAVTIRGGTVVGGVALYYSGTPAAGNLIMSIAATAGTDSFGNAYVAGVGVYGASDKFTAKAASGDTSILKADAPSGISESTSPGLELKRASGDVTAASLTEFDDTFTRGLYLRTSSPLDIVSSLEGVDYASVKMEGRFHSSDPRILLHAGDPADAPNGGIWLNSTFLNASGGIDVYGNDWTVYTPSLGSTGGATWSTRTGYWRRWGDEIEFVAYFVFSGAGSGGSSVTLTGPPFEIDRSTRQYVGCWMEALAAGNSGFGGAVAFVSGSSNVWDRVRNPANTTLTGADLTAAAILTFKGRYRAVI